LTFMAYSAIIIVHRACGLLLVLLFQVQKGESRTRY